MVWDLEEPVAPPQPSRPVLPPSRMTTSPGIGASLRMLLAGAAPSTAPISILFAKIDEQAAHDPHDQHLPCGVSQIGKQAHEGAEQFQN